MADRNKLTWQKGMGFSDRLSNIISITTALQKYDKSGKDYNASDLAKDLEKQAFEAAASKDEYEARCLEIQESIKPKDHPEDPDPEEEDDTKDKPTATIGPYQNAIYHKNGLFSTVYKASAAPLGEKASNIKLVALKVTTPSAMSPPHNSAREVRILMNLTSKDSCTVPLLDALTEPGGHLVLIFPFMHYDLEFLQRRHPNSITPELKEQIETSLFSALAYIHDRGIIHRDVKPSNVLLRTLNGPVYLADFGIAWSPTDPESEPSDQKITDVGTTCYRPPEILFGYTAYDHSLDMWAAGCLIAELEHPEHKPLFNAGPIGSELALIASIFHTLGTPDESSWPSSVSLPDWGKMAFRQFSPQPWQTIMSGASEKAIELISKLVKYEMSERLTARHAIEFLRR